MSLFDGLSNFIHSYLYWIVPTSVNVTDIIEILIIAFLIYEFLAWVRRTRAWVLFKGLIVILMFVLIAAIFQMTTILFLATRLVNVGIIAVIILFQPELRNALEHLGRKNFLSGVFNFDSQNQNERKKQQIAEEVSAACMDMSRTLTGALLVFEKTVPLDDYVRTGIVIDASISRQLIRNIFEHNTPLHDGAVIIRRDRIVAATCYLPLSDNRDINKEYGTRHRAAVGMSENSDALIIIVSEETGNISIARDSVLSAHVSQEELKEKLIEFYAEAEENASALGRIKRRLTHVE